MSNTGMKLSVVHSACWKVTHGLVAKQLLLDVVSFILRNRLQM